MKPKIIPLSLLLITLLSPSFAQIAYAGSATWNLNPTSNDWNTAANWTPATVPNGSSDTATFDVSTTTAVSITGSIEVNSLIFSPGASAFTITPNPGSALTMSGAGITNNSGITQNFVNYGDEDSSSVIIFIGSATAGSGALLTTNGGPILGGRGYIYFYDHASAGDAALVSNGGYIYFYDNSTAANATITINPRDLFAGLVSMGTAAAANATLIASGENGESAGLIAIGFVGAEGSNTARVELYGNGTLSIAFSSTIVPNVGSIEGDGIVLIPGDQTLEVGSNNLSTTFSGVIKDDHGFTFPARSANDARNRRNAGGHLTKIGTGTLKLTGSNTYSSGTTIEGGKLVVNNLIGSGTGSGSVQVDAGRLAGRGTIVGPVTVGTGSGSGAALAPGRRGAKPDTLTIQGALTFQLDSTYKFELKSSTTTADKVVANGVTINGGALFSFTDLGSAVLPTGTVFTAIDNTAAIPIAGVFASLPDGSTFAAGSNNYQVSYEGGDGNDLTLTVVP